MSVLIRRNVNVSPMEGFVGRSSPVFKHRGDDDEEEEKSSFSNSSSIGVEEEEEEEEEEESSSVSLFSEGGDRDEEDDDGDGEEVQSELRGGDALSSLGSLEDSLPIKRGLSNYFNGKAKSFSSLADVITAPTTAADLAKQEHPFNKRRRVLMAAKKRAAWPRRASCSSLSTLPHPSLLESELRVLEEGDEEEDKSNKDDSPRLPPLPIIHGRALKSFRSPRSFSLTNLQQHDEFS